MADLQNADPNVKEVVMEEAISPRVCGFCGEILDPEWAYGQRRYCDKRCRNANYWSKHKDNGRRKYLEQKRLWERSPVGKRAGLAIRRWINLPETFK